MGRGWQLDRKRCKDSVPKQFIRHLLRLCYETGLSEIADPLARPHSAAYSRELIRSVMSHWKSVAHKRKK